MSVWRWLGPRELEGGNVETGYFVPGEDIWVGFLRPPRKEVSGWYIACHDADDDFTYGGPFETAEEAMFAAELQWG